MNNKKRIQTTAAIIMASLLTLVVSCSYIPLDDGLASSSSTTIPATTTTTTVPDGKIAVELGRNSQIINGIASYTFTYFDYSAETVTFDLSSPSDIQFLEDKEILMIKRSNIVTEEAFVEMSYVLDIDGKEAGTLTGVPAAPIDKLWNSWTYNWDGSTGTAALLSRPDTLEYWNATVRYWFSDNTSHEIQFKSTFGNTQVTLDRSDIIGIELAHRDSDNAATFYQNGLSFTLKNGTTQQMGYSGRPGMIYGWHSTTNAEKKTDCRIGYDEPLFQGRKFFTEKKKNGRTPRRLYGVSGNNLYMGAVPANLNTDKPVILFVPGLGNDASYWWSKNEDVHVHLANNMWRYAYNSGYQAYYCSIGRRESILHNGETLARHIENIATLHPDRELVLVAHSKGGIDATAALFLEGAEQYVSRVITLGTPFGGSFLADEAYWMPFGIGKDHWCNGTRDMKSSNMNSYWKMMRSKFGTEIPRTVPFYCIYGHNKGPIGSLMNANANLHFMESDGVVSDGSARYLIGKGLASRIKDMDADHMTIGMGVSKTRNGGVLAPWVTNRVWDEIKKKL
jgi:hypothetical protein